MNEVCSLIVPCYNEATTIESKLRDCSGLVAEGWTIRTIVVDDYSIDDTFDVASSWVASNAADDAEVIRNAGEKGKAGAVRQALAELDCDVFAITDADVHLMTRDLTAALDLLRTEDVGAVCARQVEARRPSERGVEHLQVHRTMYERFRDALRSWESSVDSTVVPHGQFLLVKRSCGVTPRSDVRCEDIDMSLRLRKRGFRVKFDPGLVYVEFAETSRTDDQRVFVRRAVAAMHAFKIHFREFFLRRKYGVFGLVSFPLEWGLYCLQPDLLLGFLLVAILGGLGVAGPVSLALWVVLALLVMVIPPCRNLARMEWYMLVASARYGAFARSADGDSWDTSRGGR